MTKPEERLEVESLSTDSEAFLLVPKITF